MDSSPGLVLKELARAAFKKWHVFNRTSHTEELVLPLHGANTGVAAGETVRLRNQGEGSPPPPSAQYIHFTGREPRTSYLSSLRSVWKSGTAPLFSLSETEANDLSKIPQGVIGVINADFQE